MARAIQAKIVAGECVPGSALRQVTLATEVGVSRTPIREAVQKLEVRGLVQVIPNGGAVVRDPDPHEISEAYVVRAELKGLAVELSCCTSSTSTPARRLRFAASGASMLRPPSASWTGCWPNAVGHPSSCAATTARR